MANEACCTCAALLSSIPPTYDEKTEKPSAHERRLECCERAICARCTSDNPRFQTYCPYCQISTKPTPLPQGLRDPPPYSPPGEEHDAAVDSLSESVYTELPAYSDIYGNRASVSEKPVQAAGEDVLHFVDPMSDTPNSLAIRYGIPADALRRKNNIFQDHLMAGRRTVLIPGEYYTGGVSLSPRPVEGEEEELRKSKIRKFMVTCKVHEYGTPERPLYYALGQSTYKSYSYDVAVLYMKQADYDVDLAIEAFRSDEDWEKKNPLSSQKGKAPINSRSRNNRFRISGGLCGQIT